MSFFIRSLLIPQNTVTCDTDCNLLRGYGMQSLRLATSCQHRTLNADNMKRSRFEIDNIIFYLNKIIDAV